MNKFCSHCGREIQNGSSFCIYCGNNIGNNTSVYNGDNPDNNGLKIASLVIGIISIIFSILFNILIIPLAILGLILGILYSRKVKKFCAGIVLNIIGIIIPIVILLFILFFYNNIKNSISNTWDDNDYDYEYSDSNTSYEEDFDINLEDEDDYNYDYNENNNTSNSSGNKFDGNIIVQEELPKEENQPTIKNNYFKEIKYDEVVSLINNKEDFILVISQTGCGHCISYKPKVEQVANDKNILIYYIEFNLLSNDEKKSFVNYIDISGTPTTVFFRDGSEIENARISGDTDIIEIENVLRNNGYIN